MPPDAGSDATEPLNLSGSIPNTTEPSDAGYTPPEFGAIVPPEYKDRGWVGEIKDVPTLFKKMDDQHSALGRRPSGIPHDNAAPEEWREFNKSFGVPERAEEYDFKIEGKEYTDQDKAFHDKLRPVLQAAGVSNRQLKQIAPGFNDVLKALAGDGIRNQEELDKNFDTLAETTFGDRRADVMAKGKSYISKYVPEAMRASIDTLDNTALVIMASLVDGIAKDYVLEDVIPSDGSPAAVQSEAQRREEGKKLMASKAYADPFHPDHNQVKEQVQRLYGTFRG